MNFGGAMLKASPEQPPLSAREREIATAYIGGKNYREIADGLGIAPSTVRTHINNIYRKLEVTSKIELLHRMDPAPLPVKRKWSWQVGLIGLSAALLLTGAVYLRTTSNPPFAQPLHSFALVPFTHDGSRAARDGLTQDLARNLTSRVQLSVVQPSNSRLTMKGNAHAKRLARELNLRFVLYGHIVAHDDGFAGWVSLYDRSTGDDIWRDEFLSADQDLLGVGLSMLESLARAIDLPKFGTAQIRCRELREKDTQVIDNGSAQPVYEIEGRPQYCETVEIGPR